MARQHFDSLLLRLPRQELLGSARRGTRRVAFLDYKQP